MNYSHIRKITGSYPSYIILGPSEPLKVTLGAPRTHPGEPRWGHPVGCRFNDPQVLGASLGRARGRLQRRRCRELRPAAAAAGSDDALLGGQAELRKEL